MGETCKILVTGSSGFVGSYLVRSLSKQHEVEGLDIRPSSQDIVLHKKDIRRIFCLDPYDIIIHCASLVPISSASWNEYYSTNVVGTKNVLNIKHDQFIYISTSAVFSGGFIKEDTPLCPAGKYGLSKLLAENLVKNRGGVIIRPRTILGGRRVGFLDYILYNIRRNRPILLFKESRDKIIQFLHIQDLVKFIELLINKDINTGVYNIGCLKYNSLYYDLVESIKQVGSKSWILWFPDFSRILRGLNIIKLLPFAEWHRISLLNDFYFDIQKALDLGWKPKYSNVEMMVETIQKFSVTYKGSLHQASLNYPILKFLRKGGFI